MTRRTYTDHQKAEALALYETHGPTAVHERLGVPPATVVGWAKKAGIRTIRNERTAEAVRALEVDAAQRRATLADRLLRLAEDATEIEFTLVRRAGLRHSAGLRDVVGARTRAIHDHQLLAGEATQRTEHGQVPERTPEQEAEVAQVLSLVKDDPAA